MRPADLPPDDMWLDLLEADRTMLRYKKGMISAQEALTIMTRDCGVPPDIAEKAVIETDATPLETLEGRTAL
jgi:hypothetical protein